MQEQNFARRLLTPILQVLTVSVVSFAAYFGSRHLENDLFHHILAATFGTAYFISVAFGTLYVFTTAYLRGATFSERVLASFIVPFAWMTKEVFRLTESHPFQECLYWYLNPLNVWLISLTVLEMGIGTLIARSTLQRRGKDIKILTIVPVAVILLSLLFAISVYAWGQGENVYVLFLKGYRSLFGPGI